MDNITLLCLFGMFLFFVLLILPRLMDNNPYVRDPEHDYRGGEQPRYDDPDIEGRGSFGRNRGSSGESRGGSRPSVDSRNVRGRGSFGRDKDR